ncbi:unnamed protein product [Rotaria sp. Silwood2]|nr:unnamed protein product [Rotaria sp. Silwood2]CAF2956676.1 unnamed protein product [Rotaria sp. Silwood2]CAF3199471.1 unnamed protein product [Rotaria sp. Silwood2]CAF3220435.1 unnamed protein product [Rotaria sp. Silwood2]CAF4017004.1 unnamed protein product [Rotaria sp. Silwood2]
MQLQIKTAWNEKFTIECKLTDTVRTIKEKIATKNLKDKYETDATILIFSGKILEDSKTLESYSINRDSSLVVVKQAPSKNPPRSAGSADTPSHTTTYARSSSVAPLTTSSVPQQQPRTTPSTGNTPAASQDSFLLPETREKALTELTDMGFDRTEADLALRASFYHVERAAKYLKMGNIPNLNERPASSQGDESGQTPAGGRPPAAYNLSKLIRKPSFRALRHLIQEDPDSLQIVMLTLQVVQPKIFQIIKQRQQEFLELVNEADEREGGDDKGEEDDDENEEEGADDALQGDAEVEAVGGQVPPGTITIILSSEDQQAINRLQDMGFQRNHVIEAYIARGRNEKLAANYLLSRSFD